MNLLRKGIPPMKVWGSILTIMAILATIWLLNRGGIPADAADGRFSNDCCTDVVLRDGTLTVGDAKVGYVIGRDAAGPFILPDRFVGTWEDEGIQIDGTRKAVRLPIDRIPNPTTIRLSDFGRSYVFRRRASHPSSKDGTRSHDASPAAGRSMPYPDGVQSGTRS